MDTVASRVIRAREAHGWTQSELARRSGVSQGTIGNIEAGIRNGLQSLADIADTLGVRYRWLRDGEEPMQPPALSWPFDQIEEVRFMALTQSQKDMIQGQLMLLIQQFEAQGANGKRLSAA